MGNIVIMTDSTNDLNKAEIEKYDIKVIPLYVNFGDISYKDNVDIDTVGLYKKVETEGALPKTAAITIGDFINYFKPYVDNGDDVIYTGISSYMSSTYSNALLAAKELEAEDKIHVVDSQNLSTGIGLILLTGCEARQKGKTIDQVVLEMEAVVPKVRSQFMIDTFEYLHKGGRCSSMAKIFGTMLKIKPIITVRNGKMNVAQKPHGHNKAIQALLDQIIADKDRLAGSTVMVTHSMADEDAVYLENKLKQMNLAQQIMVTKAGCVISSHCGQGTIGILYIIK